MRRLLCIVLLATSIALPVQASEAEAIEMARIETVSWLSLTDTSQYESSWDAAAALFQGAITKEDWVRTLGAVRNPIGVLRSREVASANFNTTLPGAPDGEYVVFQFSASFENKAAATETVTAMKGPDGVWRVAGYFIK